MPYYATFSKHHKKKKFVHVQIDQPRLTTAPSLPRANIVALIRGNVTAGPNDPPPPSGTVKFSQDTESGQTTISWDLSGNDKNAKRGIHIHQFGDNTTGCVSAGPHCEFCSRFHLRDVISCSGLVIHESWPVVVMRGRGRSERERFADADTLPFLNSQSIW